MKQEHRRAWRICPCRSWDVEGIQTWLEDLAAEGLVLEDDGYFWGMFSFLRTTPRRIVYRLEPVQREPSFFDNESPDEELVETSEQMGWKYLTRYGMFYICCAEDPSAPELHTDPVVQTMALRKVRKRMLSNVLACLFWLVIWPILKGHPFGYPVRSAATIGSVFVISILLWFLFMFTEPLFGLIRLEQYRRRLASGDSINRRKAWQKHRVPIIAGKLLRILLPIICISAALSTLSNADKQPIEMQTDPPFVTIADLIPDGIYSLTDGVFDDYNQYRQWSTAIAPINYEWIEWAQVTDSDGTEYSGILRIDYHETLTPWLAEQLAEEYYSYDRHRYGVKRFQDLEIIENPIYTIRIYSNYLPYILIQYDNVVIHATTTLEDSHGNSSRDLWIERSLP